jgi:hypothetical protein
MRKWGSLAVVALVVAGCLGGMRLGSSPRVQAESGGVQARSDDPLDSPEGRRFRSGPTLHWRSMMLRGQ